MSKKIEAYIKEILKSDFGDNWEKIYKASDLIKYLNLKSGAIHGNSKSRRSLANWYAIYAILHYYKEEGFVNNKDKYLQFNGFKYSDLFQFQRNQYGGSKLQNHGFNNRAITEFSNKAHTDLTKPLIIDNNGKYLIHPDYIYVNNIDIVPTVLKIIKKYQQILYDKDHKFEKELKSLLAETSTKGQKDKLLSLLTEDSEARIFELISYSILETHYKNKYIFIGYTREDIKRKALELYKTGRTNANDGGIDFVMRPLGRFFQVTEVGNYNKYFLDIDKVNKFPITFVVKTNRPASEIRKELIEYGTEKSGGLKALEDAYHQAVEEVITINELKQWMEELNESDITFLVSEIDKYYKLEMDML